MKILISADEIRSCMEIPAPEFPKYVSILLNLANRYSQGTRPQIVGQVSDLIQEFKGGTLSDWKQWYSERWPTAINDASARIYEMVGKFKAALKSIDKDMVERWVRDLVVVKTFLGLRFQEAILKKAPTS